MRWLFSLLLLVGCQRYDQWQTHHIKEKTAGSTRVQYKTRDQVAGIDIEFIRTGQDLATYLQVHGQPISLSTENKTEVKLITDNRVTTFLAHIHKGKQRIRLSKILQEQLISILTEGNSVIIELPGYRERVDPQRFQKVLKELNSDSSGFLSKFKVSMMG